MSSSIGHFLILLFSTTVLIKEGATKSHHDGEKVEEGSQKPQEDEELVRGYGGRLLETNSMIFGPPQVPPGLHYQQSAQRQQGNVQKHRPHHSVRGEINLDLSNILNEMGGSLIMELIGKLDRKMDSLSRSLKDTITQNSNDFTPPIQNLISKADYLTQAVQTLNAGMQSLNTQMNAQQQLLQQNINKNCDTSCFEQPFHVLHDSLHRISQEVKEFKVCQSEAMRVILQGVARNSETVSVLQDGVAATYNSCSACCNVQQSHVIPFQQMVGEVVTTMVSSVSDSLLQNVQSAVNEVLKVNAKTMIRHFSHQNEETKSFMLSLSQKMMDYRDEYLRNLMEQANNMEVIKKTVSETTQVMRQAAAGTQQAANLMAVSAASAKRSLDSSSMRKDKKTKGN